MTGFITILGVLIFLSVAYAAGRIHQWYRTALERDDAWRAGYDQASGTLFKLAARVSTRRRAGEGTADVAGPGTEKQPAPTVVAITEAPSFGRHSLELRHEQTRRLSVSQDEAV